MGFGAADSLQLATEISLLGRLKLDSIQLNCALAPIESDHSKNYYHWSVCVCVLWVVVAVVVVVSFCFALF